MFAPGDREGRYCSLVREILPFCVLWLNTVALHRSAVLYNDIHACSTSTKFTERTALVSPPFLQHAHLRFCLPPALISRSFTYNMQQLVGN